MIHGDFTTVAVFPAEAKLGQVAEFLRVVRSHGGRTQVSVVARELHEDLLMLLPVMDAVEMLGLASVERGDVKLSRTGEELAASGRPDFSKIGEIFRGIEPFKCALSLGKFRGDQVASQLVRQGVRWHHEDPVNESVVKEILIQWGIAAGLLEYDGSRGIFRAKASR